IVASLSYVAGQWPVAVYLGPYLPDVTGALASFWIMFAFTKLWRPRTVRGFGGRPIAVAVRAPDEPPADPGSVLRAWSPYIVLILIVVAWTGPWSRLPSYSLLRLAVPGISSITRQPFVQAFNLNPLSGGTAILASWIVILLMLRPGMGVVRQVLARTFHQMWGAL